MNRVIRQADWGKYICVVVQSSSLGAIRKYPPFRASRSEAKMLGESKRGAQKKSIVPSFVTSADVCRSPMRPWSLMRG